MILEMPRIEIWVWSSGGDTSSGKSDDGQRSSSGTIKKTIEMLASQIWHNLGLPKQVIVPCEFDCDKMMNRSERGRCVGGRNSRSSRRA